MPFFPSFLPVFARSPSVLARLLSSNEPFYVFRYIQISADCYMREAVNYAVRFLSLHMARRATSVGRDTRREYYRTHNSQHQLNHSGYPCLIMTSLLSLYHPTASLRKPPISFGDHAETPSWVVIWGTIQLIHCQSGFQATLTFAVQEWDWQRARLVADECTENSGYEPILFPLPP